MRRMHSLALITALSASPAFADRAPTPAETEEIVKTLEIEGCSGGDYEVEEENGAIEKYKVTDARCPHGVIMDFDLDSAFSVISRSIED